MLTNNETKQQRYIRELVTMTGYYAVMSRIYTYDGNYPTQANYKNNYAIFKTRLYRFASTPENCL